MSLGPDLNQTVLLPLLLTYREEAQRRRATRRMPGEAEHVWAWMTTADGDQEFVVALDGHPMMDTDLVLVRLARPLMEEIASQSRWEIRLVRFDRQGVSIETVGGM